MAALKLTKPRVPKILQFDIFFWLNSQSASNLYLIKMTKKMVHLLILVNIMSIKLLFLHLSKLLHFSVIFSTICVLSSAVYVLSMSSDNGKDFVNDYFHWHTLTHIWLYFGINNVARVSNCPLLPKCKPDLKFSQFRAFHMTE